MELSKYKWPDLTQADIAFSTQKAPVDLLAEAESRDLSKGRKKFSELFYRGGKIQLQPDVKGTWKEKAWIFAKCLMRSWEPKHEDKEAVCAMIFEEVLIID